MRCLLLSMAWPIFSVITAAQPDTLLVTSGDTIYRFAIVYEPIREKEQFKRTGRYAYDTARVAVQLDYKMGKPSGVYRAFYPDGKPLIFAVYGWGSLHGDWTEYDEFGEVSVKGQYRDGLRDGVWAFRALNIVGHYKEGKRNGKWKYYQDGRLVKTERYRDDVLITGDTFLFNQEGSH